MGEKRIKKEFLKEIKKYAPFVIFAVMAVVMAISIYFRFNANSIGVSAGNGIGSAAGRAVGSFEGMTKGRIEGTEAGKAEGLSAKDTLVDIEENIKQTGQLEVLVSSVKLKNIHTIGEKINYASLNVINGKVIYTVDMSEAEVNIDEDGNLCILLPKPEAKLIVDAATIRKIGEYQTKFFNGSAEEGYDAYINTFNELNEAAEKNLDNYWELLANAEDAARNQVESIVNSASVEHRDVEVNFAEDNNG